MTGRHLLLASAALSALAVVRTVRSADCPLFADGRSAEPNWNLLNCTAHRPNSCCSQSDETAALGDLAEDGLVINAPPSCYEVLNFMQCSFCSGQQVDFVDAKTTKITICEHLCYRVWKQCHKGFVNGVQLKNKYADGIAFCEANNFDVLEDCNNKKCTKVTYSRYCFGTASDPLASMLSSIDDGGAEALVQTRWGRRRASSSVGDGDDEVDEVDGGDEFDEIDGDDDDDDDDNADAHSLKHRLARLVQVDWDGLAPSFLGDDLSDSSATRAGECAESTSPGETGRCAGFAGSPAERQLAEIHALIADGVGTRAAIKRVNAEAEEVRNANVDAADDDDADDADEDDDDDFMLYILYFTPYALYFTLYALCFILF